MQARVLHLVPGDMTGASTGLGLTHSRHHEPDVEREGQCKPVQ